MNRREFSQQLYAATLSTAFAKMAFAQQQAHDTSGQQSPKPEKPEEIAMLIYPGMTALDLVGPEQVFGYLGNVHIELVAKTKDLVKSDTAISIQPTKTFSDCADPVDIVFVGGGADGTIAVMKDTETLDFLSRKAKTAKLVTSVCTGSMILGAAGLLRGYKATSHWSVRDFLPLLGAELVVNRVVEDRNRITSGGITAGMILAFASQRSCGERTTPGFLSWLWSTTRSRPMARGRRRKHHLLSKRCRDRHLIRCVRRCAMRPSKLEKSGRRNDFLS